MKDQELYDRFQSKPPLSLFTPDYIEKVNAAGAVNWLHQHNVVFIIAPPSDVCQEIAEHSGGYPTYHTTFVAFGKKASAEVEKLARQNPLLILRDDFTTKHKLYNSYGFGLYSTFNYRQFIELLEYSCTELKKQQCLVKRFKIDINDEERGKLTYVALKKGVDFNSFLENYRGQVDLYDKSLSSYVAELMTENFTVMEQKSDDST